MTHNLISLLLSLAALSSRGVSGQGQEGGGSGGGTDGAQHLTRCIRMAEPLVRSPDYIFPLTVSDIEVVCKLWEDFVYCVREYAVTHLSAPQQQEFYQVIDSSIKSANELCRNDPEYMRAYMGSAPCLRRVSTNASLCGGQYQYMADIVQGLQASDAQVCCAHLKFRECVLQRTPRECDGLVGGVSSSGTPPSHFMRTLLDRALGYLLQKCQNFVPNARDCPQSGYRDLDDTTTTTTSTTTHHHTPPHHSDADTSHNHLNPHTQNSPQNGPSSTTQTTRFTWTTAATPLKSTPDPSLSLAGNSLFGAESQQYRGSGMAVLPSMALLTLLLLLGCL